MVCKIDPKELNTLLNDALTGNETYKLIEGVNPCKITYGGLDYYVYIKNITPTAFPNANPEVMRVQLPKRNAFSPIKESDSLFVFLGYDSTNDVYATWNPFWSKQRLNVVDNVSFYSRLSAHQEARAENKFVCRKLNNDGEVVVFPRENIGDYLSTIQLFFPETSEYVAIGSKRRTSANESFKMLCNSNNITYFREYLNCNNYSLIDIADYCGAIKLLIDKNLFSTYRKLFLSLDSIDEYHNVINNFLSFPEVQDINKKCHNTIAPAFRIYVQYLISISKTDEKPVDETSEFENEEQSTTSDECTSHSEIDLNNFDWEKPFIDNDGKLTRIANPKLLDLIREYLIDPEYRKMVPVYNTINNFYQERFTEAMELSDWREIIDDIDWNAPYYNPNDCETDNNEELSGKRKAVIIRVNFPDGQIVQEKRVSETLVKVVEYADPERVRTLNISTCGSNIILAESEINPRYASATKYVDKGLYVNTCSDTPAKYNAINKISDELGIGLQVNYVSIESNQVVSLTPQASSRSKIKVTMPDGKVIQHSKVLHTLIDVILYAGILEVEELNIRVNKDNLVTNKINPIYEKSLKPLGDGFYVHTNSGTDDKYNQILEISKGLSLGLIVELV